jgi:hypothetical protein
VIRRRPEKADYPGDLESYYLDTADYYQGRARRVSRLAYLMVYIAAALIAAALALTIMAGLR